MAVQVNVAGAVLVKIDYGSGLANLGYTIRGVEITEEIFDSDVPGDQNGGEEGPPIDVQRFGEIHRVRTEFSTFDPAVSPYVVAKIVGGTQGTLWTPGSLMGQASLTFRLLLTATNFTRNYLRAFPVRAIELNAGTKYSRLAVEWACHGNSAGGGGVIWNTTTS